jgi:hypothetical protein
MKPDEIRQSGRLEMKTMTSSLVRWIGFFITVALATAGFVDGMSAAAANAATPQTSGAVQVSVGYSVDCGLRTDTTITCWGAMSNVSPPTTSGWTSIAVGSGDACAVKSGAVDCWGSSNIFGQLTPPAGVFSSVTPGGNYFCGLQTNGDVACWGDTPAATPSDAFSSVDASGDHVCGVVTSDHSAECWGSNFEGEASPPSGTTFLSVSAGTDSSCGVRTNDQVACWGGTAGWIVPTDTFSSVSVGGQFACGVKVTNKAIACWGLDDGRNNLSAPSGTFTSVSSGASSSCGARTDNTVVCWGNSVLGQTLPPASGFASTSLGQDHYCGLRIDGTAKCWGVGGSPSQAVPAPSGGFLSIESGPNGGDGEGFSCGLRTNLTVSCWGSVVAPPTGTFLTPSAATPDPLSVGAYGGMCGIRPDHSVTCWGVNAGSPGSALVDWVSVGAGYTCAVKHSDHTLECSGSIFQSTVAQPSGTFRSVSAGPWHACAVRTNQTVACWGQNDNGESTPPPDTFLSVSAGFNQSCGLTTSHTIECWGNDASGEAPSPSGTFSSVSAGQWTLSSSGAGTCGVHTDGVFQCWGTIATTGGPIGPGVAVPKMGISNASVVEGASGTRPLRLTVSLGSPTLVPVSATYSTANGTATAGSDYVAKTSTVTIPAGVTSVVLPITVNGDSTNEGNETFSVTLSNVSRAANLGRATGIGTILNDDPPAAGLRVAVGDGSVMEGRTGTRAMFFTVSLSKPAPGAVSVKYATHDGTAHSSGDYLFKSGSVTIAKGATSTQVAITVNGDGTVEPNETFTVKLSSPTGSAALLGRSTGTGTILNDD